MLRVLTPELETGLVTISPVLVTVVTVMTRKCVSVYLYKRHVRDGYFFAVLPSRLATHVLQLRPADV